MDSELFIDSAKKIKPTWLIVLYASNVFILNCVSPSPEPIIKENRLLNNNIFVQEKPKKLYFL